MNTNSIPNNFCQLSAKDKGDYFLYQFNTGCLAQYSYYIESNKEAVIIDPMRDCDTYLQILNSRGAKLKYIFETHFHADFVSGHVELSKLTGSKIIYGPKANPKFEAIIAKDNEIFLIGNVYIEVLHTPGHTMESSCFLLRDSKKTPRELYTGDTLFLGDVGRPDLAVSSEISKYDLANFLYNSLQLLKGLPDDVTVWPGHGQGSACGKNISSGSSDSLANQKKTNYALNSNLTKQEFIEITTTNLPTPPQYFFHDVVMNKTGATEVTNVLERSNKPINPELFFNYLREKVSVIDTRNLNSVIKGFLRGSYFISLKMNFAIWSATLLKPDQKVILIVDPGTEIEAITRLARVGYQNVLGYAEGGYEALEQYAVKNYFKDYIDNLETVDPTKVKEILEYYEKTGVIILDVREKAEWENGVIENAHLFNLSELEGKIDEIKKLGYEKQFALYCKTGGRAAIAGTILKKNGFKNVVIMGGVDNMIKRSVNFVQKRQFHHSLAFRPLWKGSLMMMNLNYSYMRYIRLIKK